LEATRWVTEFSHATRCLAHILKSADDSRIFERAL